MVSSLLLVRRKNEYIRFSKGTGQRTQYARMETAGFDWKKGKAAKKTARYKVAASKEIKKLFWC